jgi:3-dehydrocarnitine:acetyl-CoA trimethylamine transferase
MNFTDKVVLTCAVTGGMSFNRAHPHVPITPQEIADSALGAAKAGASVVHIHVRDPETGEGSQDPKLYREVVERIRDSSVDVVINLTCGGNARFYPDPADESRAGPGTNVKNVEQRTQHIVENRPELASLDVTTANQGDGDEEFVYLNTTRTLRAMARVFRDAGVKPEMEAFQAGDILFANSMVEDGLIDGIPLYQFVLGVKWGAPCDTETMLYMRNLLPAGASWAGFGIARMQMPMVAQAVLLGGNVRVGLEDNLYLSRGVFATNEQLVQRAVDIVHALGKSVATPQECRDQFGLRKLPA